ncbi:MAG TPA: hypothetical protein VFC15_07735, partial [Candidatus Limnocylindrales bacterium]|nr:hypothetical protein [Candidatus Limnocylindrales bacterium]
FGVITGLRHMNSREIHLVEDGSEHREDAEVMLARADEVIESERDLLQCMSLFLARTGPPVMSAVRSRSGE